MNDLIWYMTGAEWCDTQNGDGDNGWGGTYLGYGFEHNGYGNSNSYGYGKGYGAGTIRGDGKLGV
jgi:hypothetical protein